MTEYKTFEDWVRGEDPNRRELRRVMKRYGMTGTRRRGGGLACRAQLADRALARTELKARADRAREDADRVRTAEAALLAALEAETEEG